MIGVEQECSLFQRLGLVDLFWTGFLVYHGLAGWSAMIFVFDLLLSLPGPFSLGTLVWSSGITRQWQRCNPSLQLTQIVSTPSLGYDSNGLNICLLYNGAGQLLQDGWHKMGFLGCSFLVYHGWWCTGAFGWLCSLNWTNGLFSRSSKCCSARFFYIVYKDSAELVTLLEKRVRCPI